MSLPQIEAEPAIKVEQQRLLPPHIATPGILSSIGERMRGSRAASIATGVAIGLAALGGGERLTVGDAHAERTRYFDNEDNFSNTVSSEQVMQCIKRSVGTRDQNSRSPWSFPSGSIENQVVRARIGGRDIYVTTTLRDVNLDRTTVSANGNATSEFLFGCTYVADSDTTLQLMERPSRGQPTAIENSPEAASTIEYQEEPRVFSRNQFRTRVLRSVLRMPRRLSRTDVTSGRYCVRITNQSRPVADPYDNSQVHPAYPGASYGFRLIDPNRERGMLDNGSSLPEPKSRVWTKCLRSLRQVTFRSPPGSFWSRR